ncbi:MAG TPA: hypothetical protein VJ865_02380 [Gemmatimonadaceae bacterium]|nr:hypothetical protein [Gemmatimonadaceae bacterium]
MKAIQAARHSARRWAIAACMGVACAIPREQRELAAADAETFEAIVRSQMTDSVSAGFLRVDSRPAGDKELLSPTPERAGFDPDSLSDTVAESSTRIIADQRKEILQDLHVEEGGPFVYPSCGGFRTRRFRDSAAVHPDPDCPKAFRRYVTVGLPTRGASLLLNKARRPEIPPPDTTGELWTVLVTESSVGPGGQQWRQYGWLFRRDLRTGSLGIAEKYLLSWAE